MENRSVKDFLVGALVGVMSMMPGASGGIIAVIFGIYERLIADVADIRGKLLKDLRFIIPVGLGILVGLGVCAVGINALLERWEVPLMFFFAALILFQVPDIFRLSREPDGSRPSNGGIAACVIGFAVMIALIFVNGFDSGISLVELDLTDIVLLFVIGVLLALSKVVPGLSGAAILLAIGLYAPFMNLIGDMDMSTIMDRAVALIPAVVGFVVGVLGLAKAVDYLMTRYRTASYLCILGITVGSVVTVLVQAVEATTSDLIALSVVGIIAGLLCGYILGKVSARYAEETISEAPGTV